MLKVVLNGTIIQVCNVIVTMFLNSILNQGSLFGEVSQSKQDILMLDKYPIEKNPPLPPKPLPQTTRLLQLQLNVCPAFGKTPVMHNESCTLHGQSVHRQPGRRTDRSAIQSFIHAELHNWVGLLQLWDSCRYCIFSSFPFDQAFDLLINVGISREINKYDNASKMNCLPYL